MAVQTTSLITLAQNYYGDIKRQANRRAATYMMLPKRAGGGKNIAWVAESTGSTAGTYTEGATIGSPYSDAQAAAILTWGLYENPFQVTDLALDTARTSVTPAGNLELFARNLVNASAELVSTLNQDIFTAVSGGMTGFDDAIGSTTNTYATIDRTSASYWQPTVNDPGSSKALTKEQIFGDLAEISTLSGMRPNLGVCHPQVFKKIESLYETQRRFVQNANMTLANVNLGEPGIPVITVNGCTFIEDKDGYYDSSNEVGNIYYLNTDYVHIEYLPNSMAPMGFIEQQIAVNDGFESVSAGFQYIPVARTAHAKKAVVRTTQQLVVERPNACGVRKNVKTD